MASYHKFDVLQDALGFDLTAFLLSVSREKLFEYDADFNSIPADVMKRLDFIIKLTGYLQGAYNSQGVIDWFFRKRVQLDNKAPIQILGRDNWKAQDELSQKVLRLAESLGDANST